MGTVLPEPVVPETMVCAGLGALRPGDTGDAVGAGLRAPNPQQRPPPQWQGAALQLLRARQLAAAQAAAAPEPPPRQVEPEQGDDGNARADAAAELCGVDGPLHHAGALPEVGLEGGDLAEAARINRAVRAADRSFPVRVELQREHDLGENLDTHEVPIVIGGPFPGLPDYGGQASEDDDDGDPPAEPEPGAQAPGGDPETTPCVAAHACHDEVSASAGAAVPRVVPPSS